MTVAVTNSAPVFETTPLASTNMYVGDSTKFTLPTIIDAEGHTVSITYSIPKSFIKYQSNPNFNYFKFSSPAIADIGTHTVSVTLDDGNMQTPYTFQVQVMSKPAFAGSTTSFPSLTVPLG